jgi:hypothetical protein
MMQVVASLTAVNGRLRWRSNCSPALLLDKLWAMTERKILINRAPVLTLWATTVAERLGFDQDETNGYWDPLYR